MRNASLMTIRLCFALFLAILLVGCEKWTTSEGRSVQKPALGWSVVSRSEGEGSHRYQLHATPDGKTFRLDTQTGQTSLVTDKGVTGLPDDRRIQLRVGEIYKLENGKSAIYEGNEKLSSDTQRVADALVKKYSLERGERQEK